MADSAAKSAPRPWVDGPVSLVKRVRAGYGPVLAMMQAAIGQAIADQAPRAFVWSVVGFAAGIVLFFSWPTDPPRALGLLIMGLGAGLLWFGRRSSRFKVAGVNFLGAALIAIGAGHGAAELRTAWVATPLLTRTFPATEIHGRVSDAELHPASGRIFLENLTVAGLAPEKTPVCLRITLPGKSGLPRVGDRIVVHATMRPPMRPALPDAFIFQRFLYFESVGGEGTAFGAWSVESPEPRDNWLDAFMARVEVICRYVADRVTMAIADRGDATTTAALIMGEQSSIPEDLQEAYRVSGLAHLLSISGVHMSLLGGVVFFWCAED